MTTLEYDEVHYAGAAGAARRGPSLAVRLARWLAARSARRQEAEALRALLAYDDHLLRDIGLRRCDILALVHGPEPRRGRGGGAF